METAIRQDRYLSEHTYYRFMNEVERVASYHFEDFFVDTEALIDAKRDLLLASRSPVLRFGGRLLRLIGSNHLSWPTTYFKNAAFQMSRPQPSR